MFRKIRIFCLVSILLGALNINQDVESKASEIIEKNKNITQNIANSTDGYFFTTDFMDQYTLHGSNIQISYFFPYFEENTIIQVNYTGINIQSDNKNNVSINSIDGYFFSFSCLNYGDTMIALTFSCMDEIQIADIFISATLVNDYVSISSYMGCKQQEFLYRSSISELTEDDYNSFVYGDDEELEIIEEDDIIEEIDPVTNQSKPKRKSGGSGSKQILIHGNISWLDSNKQNQFARNMEIQIWDENLIFDSLLATVYTNDSGYYCAYINNDTSIFENGYDIYIKIVLRNKDFEVFDNIFIFSYRSKYILKNCNNGTVLTINHVFDTNGASKRDQAVSIHQAATWGFDYLNRLSAKRSYLSIQFPNWFNKSAFYNFAINTIHLGEKLYHDWDTILHEFGHFAADKENLTDYWAADHNYSQNQSDQHGKWIGPLLAWSEGWATYFSMAAQEKTKLCTLNNLVPMTCDMEDNGWNIEYNSDYLLGESNEWVIARLLWDLQDDYDPRESWDSFSMGDIGLFGKIKDAVPWFGPLQNFSEFYSSLNIKVNNEYMGLLLSYYNIASIPHAPFSQSLASSTPPIFEWTAGGGSSKNPNNDFTLYIMDPQGNIIFKKNVGNKTKYEMPLSDWNNILNKKYKYIKWNIQSMQKDFWGDTGPYFSASSSIFFPAENIKNIKPIDYGYIGQYFFYEKSEKINLSNGFSFVTNRLRCGYIENEFLVLSAYRKDAGIAYLEYNFGVDIKKIDFEISLWSANELINNSNSSIKLEYMKYGDWIELYSFDINKMSTDKTSQNFYSFSLYDIIDCEDIRFIVKTNNPTGSNNKGRVVIGNIKVQY